MAKFAVLTHENDLHALVVAELLRQAGNVCHIVASDCLADSPSLTWTLDNTDGGCLCLDTEHRTFRIDSVDLVWWRRMPRGAAPNMRGELPNAVKIFQSRNIRAALMGAFLTDFNGIWVDHPFNIQRADNKLVQLRAAVAEGLRVPRTLVSQDPERIREFAEECPAVVKTVAGMLGMPALTGALTDEMLEEDGPLVACPAIYQELIQGREHLRVHIFGDAVHCARIESELLDWRHPMSVEVEPYRLDQGTETALKAILRRFELSMGIFDLKIGLDGVPVFLELNPQGQFLFVEALGGGELAQPFAKFLIQQIVR